MTIPRRRLLPPLLIVVLVVTLVPLVTAATFGRDDRSVFAVYLTALGWIAAILTAGLVFVGLEVHRHRRFRELAGPTRPSASAPNEVDQSIDSRSA